jgi:hypothetical protein
MDGRCHRTSTHLALEDVMSFKLPLDSLMVESFVAGTADPGPNTLGRDCTYEPVCPATDGVAIGMNTMEPGCTTPDLCGTGVAIGPMRTMEPGCTALPELCPAQVPRYAA